MKAQTSTRSTLHAELASLRVLPCRLVHERVLVDANGVQRRGGAVGNDPGLVRVGLCSKAVRDQQLSCAHTRARIVLDKAIVASAAQGLVSAQEAAGLHAELKRIDHAIHMTDWDKSQAEVQYALLTERGEHDGLPEVQRRLNELVARHGQLSAELAQIHGLLLERCTGQKEE